MHQTFLWQDSLNKENTFELFLKKISSSKEEEYQIQEVDSFHHTTFVQFYKS